ncbi:GTP-binding protein [Micromonospora sp. NPDC023966]|uniref:GTP-binding protein n=1 Tax=Micromonospora sp. NPDC023966 TaxID=3154699 RepID=UPI0033CAAAB1
MPRLVVLTGFLGAGKTTTMLAAGRLLTARGGRVAVITNDQGSDLVDTQLARDAVPDVGEVTGGCFCCRFEDLADLVTDLLDTGRADTILTEAVGSCTDLQATVVRPLRARYGDRLTLAPLTTIVDPARIGALDGDLGYLFDRQLAEANLIAVNKSDALPRAEFAARLDQIRRGYPDADVLGYSASRGEHVDELVARWTGEPPRGRDVDLDVDYDRYAAAEARLSWLNQVWHVSADGGFSARRWAHVALESLSAACARRGDVIGHAKLAVQSPAGLIRMSVVAAGDPPRQEPARRDETPVARATVLVNVRATCPPADLESLVRAAAYDADLAAGAAARPGPANAFAPSYPRPVHRLPATPA